jgi:TrmH family RNA methyltransferase
MRSVLSRQNALVRSFRDAARDAAAGRVLLDGAHVIRAALDAERELTVVAVSHRALSDDHEAATLAHDLDRAGVDVVAVSDVVLAAISPVRSPSGIAALTLLRTVAVEEILSEERALVLAAVDVQDPGNLGALVRAAEAGGATGIVVCGSSAHPLAWKALRGSMGSSLRLPIAVATSPGDVLTRADLQGLHLVAAVVRRGADPNLVDLSRPVLLVVGGEGAGLSDQVVAACHECVSIPMEAPVESLNVAVAAAVLVYEARRQRLIPRPPGDPAPQLSR